MGLVNGFTEVVRIESRTGYVDDGNVTWTP